MRLSGLLLTAALYGQGTLEDYTRATALRDTMRPLTAGTAGEVSWLKQSGKFWYPVTTATGLQYVMADRTGAKSPAFDHARLAAALTESLGRPVKADRLNLAGLEFEEDEDAIRFSAGTVRLHLDLKTYTVSRRGESNYFGSGPRVDESLRRLKAPAGEAEVFLRNHNIWLRVDGKEVPLSSDGSEGNYYTLPAGGWSPNGKKLAVFRVRPGQRRQIHMVESSPADQVQPKLKTIPYVKPGDALDLPRPVLFDLVTRKVHFIDDRLFPNPFDMRRISWRKDSRAFHFGYNERGHQVFRVIEVDASTGVARAVIEETSSTFFHYSGKMFRHDIDDGRETIWMSERDGWNHLYLYDGASGKVKNQITRGAWPVRSVVAVDDEKRQIYFLASGIDEGKDPYYRHLFRIGFDGSGLTRLSTVNADHSASVSKDFAYFTLTYSRTDLPPVTELYKRSGELVKQIERVELAPLATAGFRAPEPFVAKGRDGRSDVWGLIYRPSRWDASKKYPVLEYIYAGPHDSFVPKTFSAAHPMQEMAELGFIVVQMDGMGTSNRSKAFHDVAWKHLGDAGFPDRILWHKAVAAKYSYYDLTHLGIYGHSAGGQSSLAGLLQYPDFYKAAASSAGCHDNRMDKIWWNEQWMGWPVGEEYAASSNVDNAHKLKGRLLLAVGELDTNVDPASTMQVVNALIKAGKVFDLLVIPGADHGLGEYWNRKRQDFFVRTLLDKEPPDWNTVKPPPAAAE
ncbi:MAG: S9 family peptidase [Acidobacteria bacterium]|nr:S9 family peptidase [Acidobacteriota bacterium]